MAKQCYIKQDPEAPKEKLKWISMTWKEFLEFSNSQAGCGRCFIDMEDFIIEVDHTEYVRWIREKNHSDYLRKWEKRYSTVSLYNLAEAGNGEDYLPDENVDVEMQSIQNIQHCAMKRALKKLSKKDFQLIMMRYGADTHISEAEMGALLGISQSGVSRRLKRIKKILKKLVIEFEKNQQ